MIPRLRVILSFLFVALLAPLSAGAAASLGVAPKDGTYIVGNEFTVGIVLDTGGVSVNAVEGKIRYLPDDLSIIRIDRTDSPVSSWTVEPDHTTEEGLILFGGVNPSGITGKGKTLFSVTFRVLRSGEARLRIASGAAILAEGGAGTNILTDLRGGTYTLVSKGDRIEALHGGPSLLRSSSHPDENAWYKDPNVSLEWSHAPDTDQVRFSVDQNPEGSPTGTLEGNTEGKSVVLSDGVWYGHLALHDDSGWSPIGHLRVQIDTERPEILRVTEIPRGDQEVPRPVLSFEAADELSGISHYEVSVGGEPPARYEDDGNHRFELPVLSPGEHVISVRAFDRAGNSISETIIVSIQALPLPTVEPIPSAVSLGGEIDVEGKVEEGTTARISIGFDGGEVRTEDVASGPGGVFIHTFVFPQEGVYRFRIQAIDQRGATSEWTPEIAVRVEPRSLLGAIGGIGDGGSGVLFSTIFLVVGVLIGMRLRYGVSMTGIPGMAGDQGSFPQSSQRTSFFARTRSFARTALVYGKTLVPRNKTSSGTASPSEESQVRESRGGPSHTVSLKRAVPPSVPHTPTVLRR